MRGLRKLKLARRPSFGRRVRLSSDVRDMSAGGWMEAALLSQKERGERAHDSDRMIERERWDLLG
jgi:hypothetical protein